MSDTPNESPSEQKSDIVLASTRSLEIPVVEPSQSHRDTPAETTPSEPKAEEKKVEEKVVETPTPSPPPQENETVPTTTPNRPPAKTGVKLVLPAAKPLPVPHPRPNTQSAPPKVEHEPTPASKDETTTPAEPSQPNQEGESSEVAIHKLIILLRHKTLFLQREKCT